MVFISGSTGSFSLVCAPLMFTLQHKPELYQEIEKGLDSVDDVDYELLRNEVLKCFYFQNMIANSVMFRF